MEIRLYRYEILENCPAASQGPGQYISLSIPALKKATLNNMQFRIVHGVSVWLTNQFQLVKPVKSFLQNYTNGARSCSTVMRVFTTYLKL